MLQPESTIAVVYSTAITDVLNLLIGSAFTALPTDRQPDCLLLHLGTLLLRLACAAGAGTFLQGLAHLIQVISDVWSHASRGRQRRMLRSVLVVHSHDHIIVTGYAVEIPTGNEMMKNCQIRGRLFH